MGFGNLNTSAGQAALNSFLEDKSYIEGYVPSQGDVAVFESMSGAPDAKYEHVLRWYKHILSYKSKFPSLPGVKKPVEQYGSGAVVNGKGDAGSDEDSSSDFDEDDLFASEDEDEKREKEELKAKRLAEYEAKKAKKAKVIAKSNIVLDVKPWSDETCMAEMETKVRSIEADGLVWGGSKLVEIGYGIKKLQITCVVEDDKISTDWLEEEITAFEDHVQSMDIAAFNKI